MRIPLALLAACALVLPAAAAELGDDAPALKISDWIQGEPVDLAKLKGQKVCVVEFWATWCGPCRQSIPHLTEMHRKFADKAVFVGVSNEAADKVKPFVTGMGEKMDYTVALDADGKTNEAYMAAYGQNGIPCAFVIDKAGKVVWVGHPMAGLDKVLEAVTAGTFDAAKFKQAQEAAAKAGKLANEYLNKVAQGAALDSLKELADQVIAAGAGNAELMNEFAWTILTDQKIQNRDLALALRAAKAGVDASEGKDAAVLDTYARALSDNGKAAEAVEVEKKALSLCKEEEKADMGAALAEYQKKAKP